MTIETDISEIRERLDDTQAIYREVCALLFFRYGETPTANRLYQLVRKGSMSAPAKALRDFWGEMREKSRIDVGQPDLPADVAAAAGNLAARLWRLSLDAADASLAAFRVDAQAAVDAAQIQVRDAEVRAEASEAARREVNARSDELRLQLGSLESQLVEQRAANAALREQLAAARSEASMAAAALGDARRDFSVELEKLRDSLAQNEQRLAAAERRALLEIETERTAASRARKELQQANDRIGALEAAHRQERDALRDDLAGAKARLASSVSQCSELERTLRARTEELTHAATTTAELRQRLESISAKLDAGRTPGHTTTKIARKRNRSTRPLALSKGFAVMNLQRRR
ncbi:DNA-binding protein [Paraburkholderia caribensis]|uniref:DNA-binding protein n=1 Tax=Paraburkholderia caribensis TaxID=75105 RepID=UPI0018D285B2|nr:DNA-binding protein [Paraburkholderia caribensis]